MYAWPCDIILTGGQRKKVKWGLYMWIYLDCEDLCGGVSKALPTNVSIEVGLEGDEEDGEPVLIDDTKKTKK